MKIAIYGDSWASEGLDKPHSYLGWPEILAKQPGYEITNFAVPGSSVYFSYKEFVKHHVKYDINVFLISSPGRLFIDSIPKYSNTAKHISSIQTLKVRKELLKTDPLFESSLKNKLDKIYNALDLYYNYLQDDEYDLTINKALVHHAKSITTNTIFIPCFKGYDEFPLIDIMRMEDAVLEFTKHYSSKDIHLNAIIDNKVLVDNRVCHMTKSNNQVLAEKIIKAINSKNMLLNLSIDDFVAPTENKDDVYVWKNL